MTLNAYKDIIKKRKGLVISIAFHVVVIIALLIFLSVFKTDKKEHDTIQEIELFTPPEQKTEEQPQQPEQEPVKKEKQPEEEPLIEEKKETKQKTPAPEPFKTKLKNNVIRKWDTIEKKNLQNQ